MSTDMGFKIPSTFYMPGLHFWGQASNGRTGIVCQNTNGAVELNFTDETVVIHAPHARLGWADDVEKNCTVLGGVCWTGVSSRAFVDFLPMLFDEDPRAALQMLAAWHDSHFRGGAS